MLSDLQVGGDHITSGKCFVKKLVHQWMDTAGMKSVMCEDKGGLKVMKSFFRCHVQ